VGVVFPSRCVRTEPLTPLSPPPVRPVTLARSRTSQESPRPTPTRPRERACRRDGLECLPSIEDPRPATPSRAPGLGLSDTTAWPPRSRFTMPLRPRRPLRVFASLDPRPRAPLPAESALVWILGFARRLLQPNSTRGHTLRAADPRTRVDGLRPTTRRHEQMPVASAPRCVAASWTSEPRPGTRRLSHVAFHLRERGQVTDRSDREKAELRARDEVAQALLVTLRAPGSPVRFTFGSGWPGGWSHRPRSLWGAPSRKVAPSRRSRCFPSRRYPYTSRGLLLGARLGRSPFTPPPWRHCSGATSPLSPSVGAPL